MRIVTHKLDFVNTEGVVEAVEHWCGPPPFSWGRGGDFPAGGDIRGCIDQPLHGGERYHAMFLKWKH